MPPKKLTEEEKQEIFDQWKTTPEYERIEQFQKICEKVDADLGFKFDRGITDISINFQPFLDKIFEL
jgi:hypothetical protein